MKLFSQKYLSLLLGPADKSLFSNIPVAGHRTHIPVAGHRTLHFTDCIAFFHHFVRLATENG